MAYTPEQIEAIEEYEEKDRLSRELIRDIQRFNDSYGG